MPDGTSRSHCRSVVCTHLDKVDDSFLILMSARSLIILSKLSSYGDVKSRTTKVGPELWNKSTGKTSLAYIEVVGIGASNRNMADSAFYALTLVSYKRVKGTYIFWKCLKLYIVNHSNRTNLVTRLYKTKWNFRFVCEGTRLFTTANIVEWNGSTSSNKQTL